MTPSLNPKSSSSDISYDTALQEQAAWYALRVRSRHEKKVAAALEQKGIEVSLPLMQISRRWSDRQKIVQEPLFRGYVFTRIPLQLERVNVIQTYGAVNFAGIGGKISSIPDVQMYWLNQVFSKNQEFEIESIFPVGQRVRVSHGPWRGIEGVIQEMRASTKLIVWMDALMQGVSVQIDAALVEPLKG